MRLFYIEKNYRNSIIIKKMIKNWFEWTKDDRKKYPKIHPTQKPIGILKRLIEIFTDEGDVVIDPVCGSGSTIRAAIELGRDAYGFEIKKELFEPHMRKWADEATKTAVWEVYKFIYINTVAPFGTFRTKIRKWKKMVL